MKQNGYIAISMVLLLSVVTLAVATTVVFLSIGEGQLGLNHVQGEKALNVDEECAEDLLLRMKNDGMFATTITSTTFSEAEGTCSLTKSGNTWTITNTSPSTNIRTLTVTFTSTGYGVIFTPGTTGSNWVEP